MSSSHQGGSADEFVRNARIITAGMMSGIVVFAVIATALLLGKEPGEPLIGYLAAAFGLLALVVRFIVPERIVSAQRRQLCERLKDSPGDPSAEALGSMFQTKTVLENAVLEFAAFFALVACIVTGHLWVLGVAAVMLIVMALLFPSRSQFEHWSRDQLELIQAGRRARRQHRT